MSRKATTFRPKSMTLEAMAISRVSIFHEAKALLTYVSLLAFWLLTQGIIESPASNHPLVERLRTNLAKRQSSTHHLSVFICSITPVFVHIFDVLYRGTDGQGFCDLQRRFNVMDRGLCFKTFQKLQHSDLFIVSNSVYIIHVQMVLRP